MISQSSVTARNHLEGFGPQLCQIIIRNISGEGFRSDMDILAEPLKKLAFAHPKARTWLQEALFSPSFTSQKVSDNEKSLWLQKVLQ